MRAWIADSLRQLRRGLAYRLMPEWQERWARLHRQHLEVCLEAEGLAVELEVLQQKHQRLQAECERLDGERHKLTRNNKQLLRQLRIAQGRRTDFRL